MTETKETEEDQVEVDFDLIERIEEFGYPRSFIEESIENNEMNNATTGYYLLERAKYQTSF